MIFTNDGGIMKFIRWLFSGEVLLAGFLVGNLFTSLTGGLIVFSHLFMALSFVVFLYRTIKKGKIINEMFIPNVIFLLILMLMLVSLFYTPNKNFGQEKVFLYSTLTAWTYFGTVLLVENKNGLRKLFQGIIFYSVLTSLFSVIELFGGADGRIGIGGDNNVIGLARISGLGIIIVVGMYFYQSKKVYKKSLWFLILIVLLGSLLGTASRGPLIALVISLVIFIPFSFKFSIKKLTITYNKNIASIFMLFGGIAFILPILISKGYFDLIINRIRVMAMNGESIDSGRLTRFDTAIEMFLDSPIIGQGIGSFSHFYWGMDVIGYAHNIFLEFLSELGLLGLLLFMSLLSYAFYSFFNYSRYNKIKSEQLIIFISVIFLLINATVSGDINGNRLLFSFLALLSLTPKFSDFRNKHLATTKLDKSRHN